MIRTITINVTESQTSRARNTVNERVINVHIKSMLVNLAASRKQLGFQARLENFQT